MKSNVLATTALMAGLAALVAVTAIARVSRARAGRHSESASPATPALADTCLITNDVRNLASFYEKVLQVEPQPSGDEYAEFHTPGAVLALFSSDAQEKYIPGVTSARQNRSAILEFRVPDVDREYARLQNLVTVWVKPPTTQPWGTRSVYFRDPDGNLVDFFAPAAPH
jgi:uncharacterized glyoxalase superfamily protein PhnB